jgi:hypothetical protein
MEVSKKQDNGFPATLANHHDFDAMAAWTVECAKVKSGSECWREWGRLSKE